MYRFVLPSRHAIWITIVIIFPGVCRLILPEAATSTTLLRIRLICCRICSVVSSKQAVTRVIAAGFILQEDTLSACFQFDNGLVGSGSWCFVAHDSAREDRIEIIGDKGMICFSVFTYEPIGLHTEKGREEICIGNPEHVQQPLIQAVVDHLLGKSVCSCDGESATLTNWVMDKILGKL